MNDNLHYCSLLRGKGYWENRISREIEFAHFLCSVNSSLSHSTVELVAKEIAQIHKEEGSVTKKNIIEAEQRLLNFRDEAKSFTIDCIGHAHIDMNWMWGLDETVSIVLDTFRTMLTLMDEYPKFTFAQSQASTYHIVEQYQPLMLDEIRKRVKEGRWEVTASAWTEFDKNMANGMSHLNQYKIASDYICELLNIDPKELIVGFEPDTFGHNARLPDILSASNIKYYYHCRGKVDHTLYRWQGPSMGEVLVFKEPSWYLGPVVSPLDDPSKGTLKTLEMDMAGEVATLYNTIGVRRMLQVYGVGDHGGGPSRIDIEGLLDMASWPIYPDVIFSTFKHFFEMISKHKDSLPIVTGEINSIFPGCYTSQSSIKRGNHESEKMLFEAEYYSSIASFGAHTPLSDNDSDLLLDGWKDLLFNQFHDILPGSCTHDSASFSIGLYQSIYAKANTIRTSSIRALANAIDTSSIPIASTQGKRAIGAGVGYNNNSFKISPVGSVEGAKRIVTLFNSTFSNRKEVVEVVLWDWEDDSRGIACSDIKGNIIPIVTKKEQLIYWQHSATIVSILVEIPPFGYSSFIFYPKEDSSTLIDGFAMNPRSEKPRAYVLDNGIIRATFSPQTLELTSLVDLRSNEELLGEMSGFLLLDEDATDGMSSWKVGREGNPIKDFFKVLGVKYEENELYQKLTFDLYVKESKINVSYTLNVDSNAIQCETNIVWREIGNKDSTPQLSFILYLKGIREKYLYDIPFGTIEREASTMHVPSLNFISTEVDSSVVQLVGRGKYGYCGTPHSMRVILLRSSSEPDMFPEIGQMQQNFSLVVHPIRVTKKQLTESALVATVDIQQVTHGQHSGTHPLNASYVEIGGPFIITSIKTTNKKDLIEIIGYESEGESGNIQVKVPFLHTIKSITLIDKVSKHSLKGKLSPDGSATFPVTGSSLYSIIIKVES